VKAVVICILGVALALALGACGADDEPSPATATTIPSTTSTTSTAKTSTTTTPKPPPRTDNVKGVSVFKMGQARDEFLRICAKRSKNPKLRKDKETTHLLGTAVTTMIKSFSANPDARFRRTPKSPRVSMRTRLLSLRLIARTRCGRGYAGSVAGRFTVALKNRPKKS